ncbi:MAG: glutamate--tRNA ligase [Spirochaetota bacterium]|jgi:glutamyl-tRNA synthetase|nr:glutamate--tRNA ligase [Spirochaetota bacterium]
MDVRVRFAPSPTGYLHIGGLRTALFNYLFAKKTGGTFILRIEDTDRTRYVPDSLQDIMASMRWIGITWDEGPDISGKYAPYTQSERLPIYRQAADTLLADGHAYRCFCTPERLEKTRTDVGYDGHCRSLPPDEIERLLAANTPHVVRLAVPRSGTTRVRDFLRGEIEFENTLQDDLVLLKSDGFPTYHLAHVADDHAMAITHVLRGEEWLSSTPKHALLFAAFGWQPPLYVHLPVIRSPFGGKLSKRDGGMAVHDFIAQGYLPDAMTNFLALLGWSADGERSMITMAELEQEFVLEKIGMGSPVFDRAKLDDLNGKYIRKLDDAALAERCRPFLTAAGLMAEGDAAHEDILRRIMPLYRERLVLLRDIAEQAQFFFTDTLDYGSAENLIPKKTTREDAVRILQGAGRVLSGLAAFTHAEIEPILRALSEELGLSARQVFMTLRIALTAREVSPGLFETMEVLGRERTLARIARAQSLLSDA